MNTIFFISLIILAIFNLLILLILLKNKQQTNIKSQLKEIENSTSSINNSISRTETIIKDEFQRNRTETNEVSKLNREELSKTLLSFENNFKENTKNLGELLRQKFGDFSNQQNEINKQNIENIKSIQLSVEKQLKDIRQDNSQQLEEMRKTVDEKLQKTLNERLAQSFETVGKQLIAVQEGLTEMKVLATDVGGLKKILSNVKARGSFGEVQLSMLLEEILSPEQYEENVRTKNNSNDNVEFAIKLPDKNDRNSNVLLPIDAKFPKDKYEQLQEAYEEGDIPKINSAKKELETTIKSMAKDISNKYLDPPNTTDFGIMFLPFEGIYAEVIRNTALLEELRSKHKVIITGPTTLAALLNSLQMGFKSLAIQKRSSEVWRVLGEVKNEFENFGGIMQKAQKNIQTGLNQLDDVMGTRTRAIQRRLRDVESFSENENEKLIL